MSGFQRSIMMGMAGGIDIITSSNAENINLRTLLDAAGFNNNVPTKITYTLNASIDVTSAAATGTATPAWQTGTIGSIHTVSIYINGAVKGYGGAGGARGAGSVGPTGNGAAGATGGTSMSFACNATLIVNSGGSVLAGGGGGGGGGGAVIYTDSTENAAGGAGGLGAGTASAASGASGQTACDGDNCAYGGAGGAGGAHGASGSTGTNGTGDSAAGNGGAGGSGGYAVAKNSNTITTTNNGTISGTQG